MASSRCRIASTLSFNTGQAGRAGGRGRGRRRRGPGVVGRRSNPRGAAAAGPNQRARPRGRRGGPGGARAVFSGVLFRCPWCGRVYERRGAYGRIDATLSATQARGGGARRGRGRGGAPRAPARARRAGPARGPGPARRRGRRAPGRGARARRGAPRPRSPPRTRHVGGEARLRPAEGLGRRRVARVRRPRRLRDPRQGVSLRLDVPEAWRDAPLAKLLAAVDAWEMTKARKKAKRRRRPVRARSARCEDLEDYNLDHLSVCEAVVSGGCVVLR